MSSNWRRPGSHSVTRNSRPVFSYDNRNWDAVDTGLIPEIAACRERLRRDRVDVFLAPHNTEGTDYVKGPPAMTLAGDLVRLLREKPNFYDPASPRNSMGRGPIDKGRVPVSAVLRPTARPVRPAPAAGPRGPGSR